MSIQLLLLLSGLCIGQTTFDSELWVPGKTGVGTSSPGARFEARGSSATASWFQASGVDLSPAFRAGSDGTLGLSTASAARLTVSGSADSADLALELRGGDLYPATSGYQMTLGYSGGTLYRHSIRSQHSNSASSNTLTFLVWNGEDAAGTVASRQVLGLVTHSTGSTVHVLPPAGAALSTHTVQLIVSNGSAVGAGTMRRAAEASVSSALRKHDIRPLGHEAERAAFDDVLSLKHIRFRYKGDARRSHRGVAFEEAPESIQAAGGTVSFDRRLLNGELAARELWRELEDGERVLRQAAGGER